MNLLKKIMLLYLVLLIQVNGLQAQGNPPNFKSGLIFDKALYDSQEAIPIEIGAKDERLPQSASLKEWTPTPGHQGDISSCVGWAAGYGILTTMYAQLNNWTSLEQRNQNAFSALFIYNHIKDDTVLEPCMGGSTFEEAGQFLMKSGNCKSRDFDFLKNDCNRMPSKNLYEQALFYRIKKYAKVFDSFDSDFVKIKKIKKQLVEGYPILIGMETLANFHYPTSNFWKPNEGSIEKGEAHALIVIGYDDNLGAFEVMNSWGTDWGEGGYLWIKYEDFVEYIFSAYILIINEKTIERDENLLYKGGFELRVPHIYSKNRVVFEKIKANKKDNFSYELIKDDWTDGDKYQILLKEAQKNYAFYVFSIDDKGYKIHWPRKKIYDIGNEGAKSYSSEFIPFSNARIAVPPEKNKILKKEGEETDYVIILYAFKEITDFKKRVEQSYQAEGNIEERIKKGFEDLFIPSQYIDYKSDKIAFEAKYYDEEKIVPIIIALENKEE